MSIPRDRALRAEKLRQTIDRHRYDYHVLNVSSISDEALDSLKKELFDLEEAYPELRTADSPTQRVAGKPLAGFKKVPHKVAQWSFHDAFTEADMVEFDARVHRFLKKETGGDIAPAYTVELKIDGLKVVLEYEKGYLKTAATRGNGIVGEDVTENVKTLESIPLRLRRDVDLIAEGEIYMSKSRFTLLNDEQERAGGQTYANPRNVAAGTIRQLDPRIVASRKLESFIYDIASYQGEIPPTQDAELELLRDLGLRVNVHFQKCRTIQEVIEYWKLWQDKKEEEDYFIDGVVVKVAKREYQDILGYTGKAPRWGIALKFAAEQVTTVVEDIAFQVGRTGVITPVAHLRPTLVYGSTVSRATLHNEDEIKRLDVRIGDTVILQKAGDVIPDIVEVLVSLRTGKEKPFRMPSVCPACGSKLGKRSLGSKTGESAAYYCENPRCPAKDRRSFYHFTSKHAFDIEHLGPKNLDLLLDEGLIATYADIFTLKKGDLLALPRFAEKSADNLLSAIQKARTVSFPRVLVGLSIPQVGEETAEDLAEHFGSVEALQKAPEETLSAILGIGPVVARSVRAWFEDSYHQEVLQKLKKEIVIEKTKKQGNSQSLKLKGQSFVLTGSLEALSRDEAKKAIKDRGGSVSSAVSSKTAFVVVGNDPGEKAQEAERLGIRTLKEEDFLKLLGS